MKKNRLTIFLRLLVLSSFSLLCNCSNNSNKVKESVKQSSLRFNDAKFEIQEIKLNEKVFKIRAYENIIYVAKPIDTAYQKMNIYIPVEYFEGKAKGGYTAETAPVFFPNHIGGYMPGRAGTAITKARPSLGQGHPGRPAHQQGNNARPQRHSGKRTNAIAEALSKGFVVASPATRGRTSHDSTGTFTGKAPAAIVDLKAAVRYLKFNDTNMPGNAEKIISNGTSAGGALSALLGATGNAKEYEAYLKKIGAADASDNIFAVSAYCPITNLDNADIAYEWQFNGINNYSGRGKSGILTKKQLKISKDLCKLFPAYLNNLKLKNKEGHLLQLDENGEGNFKDHVKACIITSAQKALESGADLSNYQWISIRNNKVKNIDFDAYINYLGRMKTPPSFDALDISTPENQLFGTATTDKLHFTSYSYKNSTVNKAEMADEYIVQLMNPMYFIGKSDINVSTHWRIRHGAKDSDTSLAISIILSNLLQNNAYNVNFALPWDVPHSGDYDLDELFGWITTICK